MYSRYFALLSPHVSSSSEQVQIIQAKGTQTSHLPAVVYLKKKKIQVSQSTYVQDKNAARTEP